MDDAGDDFGELDGVGMRLAGGDGSCSKGRRRGRRGSEPSWICRRALCRLASLVSEEQLATHQVCDKGLGHTSCVAWSESAAPVAYAK